MLQTVLEQIQVWLGLGLDIGNVNAFQMTLRSIVVYIFTLTIVRLGSKRFLAESTAFDVIVGIMLGSVMSRAINGSAPFIPTLLSGIVLLAIHWLFAFLAFHIGWFGPIIKGNPVLLIKDGQIQERGMRRTGLSAHDIEQSIRLQGQETDISRVHLAFLERSGSISVIPNKYVPRVFTVAVKDGVQTVRIELD